MTLGIIKVKGANLNDACCEDIQAHRQELNILRQQLERQGKELKKNSERNCLKTQTMDVTLSKETICLQRPNEANLHLKSPRK